MDARLLLKKDLVGQAAVPLYLTSEKDIYDQDNAGLEDHLQVQVRRCSAVTRHAVR